MSVSEIVGFVNSDPAVTLDKLITDTKTALNTAINTVNTAVGTIGTNVNAIKNSPAIASGVIKSVQRGSYTPAFTPFGITISSVNPAKCSVTLYGGYSETQYYGSTSLPGASTAGSTSQAYVSGLAATQLALVPGRHNSNYAPGSWEIVEYY